MEYHNCILDPTPRLRTCGHWMLTRNECEQIRSYSRDVAYFDCFVRCFQQTFCCVCLVRLILMGRGQRCYCCVCLSHQEACRVCLRVTLALADCKPLALLLMLRQGSKDYCDRCCSSVFARIGQRKGLQSPPPRPSLSQRRRALSTTPALPQKIVDATRR